MQQRKFVNILMTFISIIGAWCWIYFGILNVLLGTHKCKSSASKIVAEKITNFACFFCQSQILTKKSLDKLDFKVVGICQTKSIENVLTDIIRIAFCFESFHVLKYLWVFSVGRMYCAE